MLKIRDIISKIRKPEESELVGWANSEGLAPKQNVRLKDELDEPAEALASIYRLEPGIKYQIADIFYKPLTVNGTEIPRSFLRLNGTSVENSLPTYLFTRAD